MSLKVLAQLLADIEEGPEEGTVHEGAMGAQGQSGVWARFPVLSQTYWKLKFIELPPSNW